MRCVNCGEDGPHFVPPSLGEEGFFACKKMGAYYLALRFADDPARHTTLVYYGEMNDAGIGELAAYISGVLEFSDADSFDMKFSRQSPEVSAIRLDANKHDLPEWVQDLAMMSDNYDWWTPFIFGDDGDTFMKLNVSHLAIMSDGEEFFKWELRATA